MSEAFAFLSPSAITRDGTFSPVLRSPIERTHIKAGATIEEVDGWRVASYDTEPDGAWLADISHTGKLDLRGKPERIDELTGGAALGTASQHDGVWTLRMTPTRAIVLCPADRAAQLEERIGFGATDMTCAWAGVVLGGRHVRDVFMRSSSLDVRERSFGRGQCMVGSVMRVATIVLNEGDDRFRMYVGWEYGEYFWDAILDAGHDFGIAPVSAGAVLREATEVAV